MPFRDAHEVVAHAVKAGVETGRDLAEFSNTISDDVFEVLTLEGSVASRNHTGGTAPEQVRRAIAQARQQLGH